MGGYKLSFDVPMRHASDSSDRDVAEGDGDSARTAEELRENVREAAKGSEEAIGWLYERYHARVYRYALAKLGDSHEAEDVAGDAFTAVVAKIPRFQWRGAGFEAWLFRIATNLIADRHRRAGRDADALIDRSDGARSNVESTAQEVERRDELRELLEELPADQREILLLRFAAGLSSAEAGAVMGRSANAVRQLQFRAMDSLRRRRTREEGTDHG